MKKYTQQDVDFIVSVERGAGDMKAFACGIVGFLVGIIGMGIVQYGILNWAGW